ncbi:hypothetical protein [Paenibacillus chungangensis]|uniref:Transposase n=1 Tax=Paenibacillus chungangensis TaxID=696535 RepID=A0ABW3HRZ9_9BACL
MAVPQRPRRGRVPYRIVDWHHYGGIHRSVELQLLPDHYIHLVKIDYLDDIAL